MRTTTFITAGLALISSAAAMASASLGSETKTITDAPDFTPANHQAARPGHGGNNKGKDHEEERRDPKWRPANHHAAHPGHHNRNDGETYEELTDDTEI